MFQTVVFSGFSRGDGSDCLDCMNKQLPPGTIIISTLVPPVPPVPSSLPIHVQALSDYRTFPGGAIFLLEALK